MTVKIQRASLSDQKEITSIDGHISPDTLSVCIKHGLVLVAKKGEKMVGVLRYSLFWQSIPFLDLIFLDEKFRLAGIGSAMLKAWEEEMARLGYKYVMTSTQADESAYLFYEKKGYQRVGSFLPPEQKAEEWIYTKTIKK